MFKPRLQSRGFFDLEILKRYYIGEMHRQITTLGLWDFLVTGTDYK